MGLFKVIQEDRIKYLNDEAAVKGDYILYWMQSSPRSHYNHALEFALEKSREMDLPLLCFFGLTPDFPEANHRHYQFLVEGLKDTQKSLQEKNIQMVVQNISPEKGALEISKEAALTITDQGYLSIQRQWHQELANNIEVPLIQIESNVVVPLETASPKEEYSAGTLRRKIHKVLEFFMVPLKERKVYKNSMDFDFDSMDISNPGVTLQKLKVDKSVPASIFTGGTSTGIKIFESFLKNKLNHFADLRNNPTENFLSNMSPYLHFGHISPLYLALEVSKRSGVGSDAYLEELIIRRELSMNMVYYNPHYDKFDCLPDWAKKTLLEHRNDPREYEYSLEELENALTHDPYWNAAQKEMVITGKMHGYMRMYWGKKILEWVDDPRKAYDMALYLNDKYEIDGRDPNGFTGVAWCFGKHDRAWKEREIFGKVRYMNDNGLRRKFKIDLYVDKVKNMG